MSTIMRRWHRRRSCAVDRRSVHRPGGAAGTVSGVTMSGESTTVSDVIKSGDRGRRTVKVVSTGPAMSKAERRAAGKAARAAAARRRRQKKAAAWAVGAVTLMLIVAVTYVAATRGGGPTNQAGAPPCGSAAYPPVPAGADPALCTKPTVGPGSGELTQLNVTTLIEGTGAAAATGQNVTVNYVGVSYTSGQQFDASWDRQQAFPFQLGTGGVIDGWDQGLVGVKVGSRVQLDIPANLAYGDNPTDPSRPAGPLRFVVDLLAAG
jgi:peptidylprolyl isomerase